MLEKSRRGEKKMIGPELLEMSTIRHWPSASEDASARSSSLWIRRLADSSHHGQSLPSPAALALVRPSSPHIGRTSPWSPSMSPPSSRSRPCSSLLLLPPQAPSTLSMPQEVSGDGLPGSKACIFIESTASSGSECRCFWSESLADEMGKDEEVRWDEGGPAARKDGREKASGRWDGRAPPWRQWKGFRDGKVSAKYLHSNHPAMAIFGHSILSQQIAMNHIVNLAKARNRTNRFCFIYDYCLLGKDLNESY